ncbi:hypothetical protein ACHAQJ_002353 [Trichoderma viride]
MSGYPGYNGGGYAAPPQQQYQQGGYYPPQQPSYTSSYPPQPSPQPGYGYHQPPQQQYAFQVWPMPQNVTRMPNLLQLLTRMMHHSNPILNNMPLHSSNTATTAIRLLNPTTIHALVRCTRIPDPDYVLML